MTLPTDGPGAARVPRGAGLLNYICIALGASLVFLPGLRGGLIADDWMVLSRNLDLPWREVPGWFVSVRHDWYRPLFELQAALAWRLFGLRPPAYHVLALAQYIAVTALVGLAAERLTGRRGIGLVSALTFGLLHFHAEPVRWFAATSEFLAALGGLTAILGYLSFRKSGRRRALAVAGAGYLFALGSKESAVGLPVALVAFDILVGWSLGECGTRRARWLPHVPFVAAGALLLLWRLAAGNPYGIAVTLPGMLRNAGHYATLDFAAWPIDFDYTTFDPSRGWTDLLPALTITVGTLGLLGVAGAFLAARPWRSPGREVRALVVALTWSAVTLVPVLPIVAERTALLSSIGVAWVVAIAAGSAWSARPPKQRRIVRIAATAGLAAFLAANGAALVYRTAWWDAATATSRAVLADLDAGLREIPPDAEVWLVGVPDHLRYAFVFRNAFPHAGAVRGDRVHLRAVLDTELAGLDEGARAARRAELAARPGSVVFDYVGGRLVRAP
jgi:hypothetical protein